MNESQTNVECNANALCSVASLKTIDQADQGEPARFRVLRRGFLLGLGAGSLAFGVLLLTACGDEPVAPKPAAEAQAKPEEPTVPEEIQSAAQSLLGKETQVLVFGDLAKTGKQQFLAANVVPKTPKNQLPGTVVTRAVIAENDDGKWSELFRCDEYLKNAKGYLALTPLAAVSGWRIQYEQDPVKGIQLYFTPIQGVADSHQLPVGIGWNPATKRYQSLDRTYEHFLLERTSLDAPRSVLR